MSTGPTDSRSVSAHSRPGSRRGPRRRASGIYGTIITAAVVASSGAKLPTTALAVAVLLTLIVYWLAEQYADLLGEQVEHGQQPTWARLRAGLTYTWPMVSAAYLPVAALIVCRISGVSPTPAANVALAMATTLLLIYGWSAGRAAQLHGVPLAAAMLIAALFGALMIILKNVVITHLH